MRASLGARAGIARAGSKTRLLAKKSTGRGTDGVAHVCESVAGVRAESADRGDANDDDQRQHHGVLNRGRAIFVLEEADERIRETGHGSVPLLPGSVRVRHRTRP